MHLSLPSCLRLLLQGMLEPCGLPFDWHLPPRSSSVTPARTRRLSGLRQRLSSTFGIEPRPIAEEGARAV